MKKIYYYTVLIAQNLEYKMPDESDSEDSESIKVLFNYKNITKIDI